MWKVIFIALAFPLLSFASTYGSDYLTGGTCTASATDTTYVCGNAFDNNDATYWASGNDSNNGWIRYDLGNGVTKIPGKFSIKPYNIVTGVAVKNFDFQGSNDDTNWYTLLNATTSNSDSTQYFEFTPTSTAYRYFRVYRNSTWDGGYPGYNIIYELQAFECLDCSESTSTISSTSTMPYTEQFFAFALVFMILGVTGFVAWGIYRIFHNKRS